MGPCLPPTHAHIPHLTPHTPHPASTPHTLHTTPTPCTTRLTLSPPLSTMPPLPLAPRVCQERGLQVVELEHCWSPSGGPNVAGHPWTPATPPTPSSALYTRAGWGACACRSHRTVGCWRAHAWRTKCFIRCVRRVLDSTRPSPPLRCLSTLGTCANSVSSVQMVNGSERVDLCARVHMCVRARFVCTKSSLAATCVISPAIPALCTVCAGQLQETCTLS